FSREAVTEAVRVTGWEDALAACRPAGTGRSDGRWLRLASHRQRQINKERGALARLAHHADKASALLDDAVHDGEAEAGPFALLLRREKRLEQPRACLFVDAGPRIGDAQA